MVGYLARVVALGALTVGPALAEDDPMEVQRCVWSCLSNYGPADSPAYEQCVLDHCSGFDGGGQTPNAPAGWQSGRVDGGRTAYAGVDTPDGSKGVYYFCDRAGRSELMIAGVPGVAGAWALVIDGQTYAFAFQPRPNGVSTAIRPSDGVLSALRGGSRVALSGPGLPDNDTSMALKGSSRAISQTLSFCR